MDFVRERIFTGFAILAISITFDFVLLVLTKSMICLSFALNVTTTWSFLFSTGRDDLL